MWAHRGSGSISFTIRTSRMGSVSALVASLAAPSCSPSGRGGWGLDVCAYGRAIRRHPAAGCVSKRTVSIQAEGGIYGGRSRALRMPLGSNDEYEFGRCQVGNAGLTAPRCACARPHVFSSGGGDLGELVAVCTANGEVTHWTRRSVREWRVHIDVIRVRCSSLGSLGH